MLEHFARSHWRQWRRRRRGQPSPARRRLRRELSGDVSNLHVLQNGSDGEQVWIIGVFYGGQDYESALLPSDRER